MIEGAKKQKSQKQKVSDEQQFPLIYVNLKDLRLLNWKMVRPKQIHAARSPPL